MTYSLKNLNKLKWVEVLGTFETIADEGILLDETDKELKILKRFRARYMHPPIYRIDKEPTFIVKNNVYSYRIFEHIPEEEVKEIKRIKVNEHG